MKQIIAEFIMRRIESSAKKAAMSQKIVFGAKRLPDSLKEDKING